MKQIIQYSTFTQYIRFFGLVAAMNMNVGCAEPIVIDSYGILDAENIGTIITDVVQPESVNDIQPTTMPSALAVPTVFVDIHGTLAIFSRSHAAKYLGKGSLVLSMIKNLESPEKMDQKINKMASQIKPIRGNVCGMCDDSGELRPGILVDNSCGLISNDQLRKQLKEKIKKHYKGVDKKLLKKMVKMQYDPDIHAAGFAIHDKTVQFLRELKARGCRLCVLSNMNKENFAVIRNMHKALFDELFGENIILASDAGFPKPSSELYRYAIEKFSGPYILIDDQKENCQAAHAHGIKTICCPQVNHEPDVKKMYSQWKHIERHYLGNTAYKK